MSQNPKSRVKTTLYLDGPAHEILCNIRDVIGTPVAESIRKAVSEKLGLVERSNESPEYYSEIAIVRRALLAGGSWTTSETEMGTNIDGVWRDTVTGKRVSITAIIHCGKAEHCAASLVNTFDVSEVLSQKELAAANKSLRKAYKASRAGNRIARK